jgi:hypothetical protein
LVNVISIKGNTSRPTGATYVVEQTPTDFYQPTTLNKNSGVECFKSGEVGINKDRLPSIQNTTIC